MTLTQKVILFALLAIGGLCLIVGLTLMHHIGGFMRTVEEEVREQEEERQRAEDGNAPGESDPGRNNNS